MRTATVKPEKQMNSVKTTIKKGALANARALTCFLREQIPFYALDFTPRNLILNLGLRENENWEPPFLKG